MWSYKHIQSTAFLDCFLYIYIYKNLLHKFTKLILVRINMYSHQDIRKILVGLITILMYAFFRKHL